MLISSRRFQRGFDRVNLHRLYTWERQPGSRWDTLYMTRREMLLSASVATHVTVPASQGLFRHEYFLSSLFDSFQL